LIILIQPAAHLRATPFCGCVGGGAELTDLYRVGLIALIAIED
jgi:hypothetical protein